MQHQKEHNLRSSKFIVSQTNNLCSSLVELYEANGFRVFHDVLNYINRDYMVDEEKENIILGGVQLFLKHVLCNIDSKLYSEELFQIQVSVIEKYIQYMAHSEGGDKCIDFLVKYFCMIFLDQNEQRILLHISDIIQKSHQFDEKMNSKDQNMAHDLTSTKSVIFHHLYSFLFRACIFLSNDQYHSLLNIKKFLFQLLISNQFNHFELYKFCDYLNRMLVEWYDEENGDFLSQDLDKLLKQLNYHLSSLAKLPSHKHTKIIWYSHYALLKTLQLLLKQNILQLKDMHESVSASKIIQLLEHILCHTKSNEFLLNILKDKSSIGINQIDSNEDDDEDGGDDDDDDGNSVINNCCKMLSLHCKYLKNKDDMVKFCNSLVMYLPKVYDSSVVDLVLQLIADFIEKGMVLSEKNLPPICDSSLFAYDSFFHLFVTYLKNDDKACEVLLKNRVIVTMSPILLRIVPTPYFWINIYMLLLKHIEQDKDYTKGLFQIILEISKKSKDMYGIPTDRLICRIIHYNPTEYLENKYILSYIQHHLSSPQLDSFSMIYSGHAIIKYYRLFSHMGIKISKSVGELIPSICENIFRFAKNNHKQDRGDLALHIVNECILLDREESIFLGKQYLNDIVSLIHLFIICGKNIGFKLMTSLIIVKPSCIQKMIDKYFINWIHWGKQCAAASEYDMHSYRRDRVYNPLFTIHEALLKLISMRPYLFDVNDFLCHNLPSLLDAPASMLIGERISEHSVSCAIQILWNIPELMTPYILKFNAFNELHLIRKIFGKEAWDNYKRLILSRSTISEASIMEQQHDTCVKYPPRYYRDVMIVCHLQNAYGGQYEYDCY